jgi:hypothetical protein
MGDLPEPKYHTMDRDNVSVMSKVTATLGRSFVKSREFQEAQRMDEMIEDGKMENGIAGVSWSRFWHSSSAIWFRNTVE